MLPSQFELECQPACVYSKLAFWDLFYLPGRLMFLLISSIRSSFLSIKLRVAMELSLRVKVLDTV